MHMIQTLRRLWSEEEGASLVEYGMIVGLLAVICIGAVGTMGTSISAMLTDLAGQL